MNSQAELLQQWRARRDEYARVDAMVNGAKLIDLLITDFEAMIQSEADRIVTLPYASRVSGYSTEHLARLIRKGQLPNAGRPHAPRIRLGDLPRKVSRRPRASGYDVEADVASLLQRRHSQ